MEMIVSPSQFMQRYEANTNGHDLDATLAMVADEAVYLFSDQSSHVGKPAIRRVLAANFDAIRNETYSISDLRWLAVSETVAACIYAFAWSGEIGGKPASGSGRGTSVLRRDSDNWLVVHGHLSQGPLL